MKLKKLLAPELRVPRDFLLLAGLSLLAASGYVSMAHQEHYFFSIPQTTIVQNKKWR